jgi:hypothetical protein
MSLFADVSTLSDYGPLLYKSLGFDTLQQLLMACGWITIAPFGNLVNALVFDRFGRVHMLRKLPSNPPIREPNPHANLTWLR